MRSTLPGIFLFVATAFSSSAAVMYSFSQQPVNPPGSYPSPAFSFDFTVPSFLTSPTTISGSSIDSPGFRYLGDDFTVMSVEIDPGLKSASPVIANGVPFLGIQTGFNGQVVMSEGVCFVPEHYSCQPSPGTPLFDHFGTFLDGDITLTISSTNVPNPPAPSIPVASIPAPSVPAPSVPVLSVPAPTVSAPTVPAPSIPAPSIPDIPQAAVPEPKFEVAAGLLLLMFGIARRTRRITTTS